MRDKYLADGLWSNRSLPQPYLRSFYSKNGTKDRRKDTKGRGSSIVLELLVVARLFWNVCTLALLESSLKEISCRICGESLALHAAPFPHVVVFSSARTTKKRAKVHTKKKKKEEQEEEEEEEEKCLLTTTIKHPRIPIDPKGQSR